LQEVEEVEVTFQEEEDAGGTVFDNIVNDVVGDGMMVSSEEGLIPDDDDDGEKLGTSADIDSSSIHSATSMKSPSSTSFLPTLAPNPPKVKEPTKEEREERRKIGNSAMERLRRKQEEKNEGEGGTSEIATETGGVEVAPQHSTEDKNPSPTTTASIPNPTPSPVTPLPTPESLKNLLSAPSYTSSRLRLLKLFCTNILRFPSSPSYTTIPTHSSQFKALLAEDDVGGIALGFFGFNKEGGKYVWKGEVERLKAILEVMTEIENERKKAT